MAWTYNTTNNKIVLPIGDTLNLPVKIGGDLIVDGDTVMFAVSDADGNDVLCKTFTVTGAACVVRLNSEDTAKLAADMYTWNIRLIHTADVADGKVIIDNADEVVTIFNKSPKFELVDGGCDV